MWPDLARLRAGARRGLHLVWRRLGSVGFDDEVLGRLGGSDRWQVRLVGVLNLITAGIIGFAAGGLARALVGSTFGGILGLMVGVAVWNLMRVLLVVGGPARSSPQADDWRPKADGVLMLAVPMMLLVQAPLLVILGGGYQEIERIRDEYVRLHAEQLLLDVDRRTDQLTKELAIYNADASNSTGSRQSAERRLLIEQRIGDSVEWRRVLVEDRLPSYRQNRAGSAMLLARGQALWSSPAKAAVASVVLAGCMLMGPMLWTLLPGCARYERIRHARDRWVIQSNYLRARRRMEAILVHVVGRSPDPSPWLDPPYNTKLRTVDSDTSGRPLSAEAFVAWLTRP